MDIDLLQRLGSALGLGLLVGLQRESIRDPLAGIRTFALITLLGAVCGLLADKLGVGSWLLGLGLVAVAVLMVAGYIGRPQPRAEAIATESAQPQKNDPFHQPRDPGLTTEVAGLVMFGIGAYVMIGDLALATMLGGAVFLLLHLKEPMHAFVGRLGERDLRAIMQFVLIALVILPILPDEAYGPWGTLNPHHIWLMVALIVGISLGGYVIYKLLGGEVGTLLAGVLGGLISSTATTISFARRKVASADQSRLIVAVLVLATATAQARVLAEIAIVAPEQWWSLGMPLLLFLGVMLAASSWLVLKPQGKLEDMPQPENPAELKSALIFGALYALIALAVGAAKEWLGQSGMVAVALLSGLHDMDAITLTTSRYVAQGGISTTLGWQLILTASLSNLVMKTIYAWLLGSPQLGWRLMRWNAAFIGLGLALLLLLPW